MVKFYKVKDTEIRKAVQVNETGFKVGTVALIGRADEFVQRGILTPMDDAHDGSKWVVVPYVNSGRLTLLQYDTLAEAKATF